MVHAEFQINEGNDGSDVPAQNAPCCLNLGKDEYDAMTVENLPKTWHKHLDKAAQILTCHLPPSLNFFPKALLLGMVINTPHLTPAESITSDGWRRFEPNAQYLDEYATTVVRTVCRKTTFDRGVQAKGLGEVVFISRFRCIEGSQDALTLGGYVTPHPEKARV